MKFALVGAGAAGGRIVDRILGLEATTERRFCRGNVLVFDTSPTPFDGYEHVPEDRRILLGDTHREVEGEGTGGDIDLGASVARTDSNEIYREFDKIGINEVEAILLVAGFGGGTGGGTGAVLVEELQAMYDQPVYALGVLPHEDESDDRILNAARSLRTFVPGADNVILFDNDEWHRGGPIEEGYEEMNRELATRVVALLAAGELDTSAVAENRVDSSDMMRTLDTGGVSSIGYASTDIETGSWWLLSWLRSLVSDSEDDAPTDAAKIKGLIRTALTSRLTLPCDVSSADRALVVLSGPPSACSRKGFESARYWLERETETVEVLAGDEPREGSGSLSAVVLLSNVTDVPRIDEIQQRAVAVREER